MKIVLLSVIIASTLILSSCKSTPKVVKHTAYDFIIGTYTNNQNQGINCITFKPAENKITVNEVVLGSENPSFVVGNKNHTLIFASEEIGGEKGGKVTSYALNAKAKKYEKIGHSFTEGEHTCVITLDKSEAFLFAGNYSGGNIAVFSVDEKGKISEVKQVIQHFGSGPNRDRQEKPHIHDLVFSPNGKQLFATDLATDRIYIYDFNPENPQPLEPATPSFIQLKSGSGPRHLAFDTTGSYVYVMEELTATISVYSIDDDKINELQTISLSKNKTKKGSGAELKINKNGTFLYATNRADCNEIVVFAIDQKTHLLLPIQTVSTGGKTPRSFEITPDGKYILIANQDSDLITVFDVQPSGLLNPNTTTVSIPKPTYVINN